MSLFRTSGNGVSGKFESELEEKALTKDMETCEFLRENNKLFL